MYTNQTSTLTPSLTSNTTYNEILSTTYSVTTNPGSAGSVTSAGVFSATAAGTYTVTATVTYNAKGFSNITKTATATATITVTQAPVCAVTPASTSVTLNIGETATVQLNTNSYHSGGTITAASGNTSVATVTPTSGIASGGSVTIKAMSPGTTTITATCSDSGSAAGTINVTVNTPTISSIRFGTDASTSLYAGASASAPTVTFSNTNSGTTVTSYNFSLSSTTYGTVNASTGVITAKTTPTTTATYLTCRPTISYNGVSYTFPSAATGDVRCSFTVYAYYLAGFGSSTWGTSGTQFTYNSSTSTWTAQKTLTAGTYTKQTDNGFKIYSTTAYHGSNYLGYADRTVTESSNNPTSVYSNATGGSTSNIGFTATYTGTYIFELYDFADHSDYTEMKVRVYYPHQVTFNANGHGTAPSAQVVTYGGTASNPGTISAAGYTHDGSWYTTSACTTAWNFSSAITEDKTLYANWTANTYTVTLDKNASTATAGTASVTATYGSAMPSATMPTRTGYTFAGYYDASSGGTQYYTASGTSARTWNKTANTTLYAHWTANTYSVTLNLNGGTTGTTSVTATYDSAMPSATMPTRTGYTFLGYYDTSATSGGTQYYTDAGASARTWNKTADTTLYARWSLNDPSVSFDDQTFTMTSTGSNSFTLAYSANHDGVTPAVSFSVTAYPGGASSSTTSFSGDTFTTSVPGTYTVQMTVTVTGTNSTNNTITVTDTATITVYPAVPEITLSITGYSATATSGDDTVYIVMLGSEYYFEAYLSGADLNTVVNSDYTYTWYVGSQGTGNELATIYSGDCTANSNGSYVKFGTATANVADTVNQTLTLVCVASRNSVTNTNTVSLLYMKKNLIDSFELDPFQKIYNVSSSVSITADYDDTFEGSSATGYTTTVYFSPDNNAYYYAPAAVVSDTFMTSFTSTLNAYVYPAGVKYIYMNITNGTVSASSPPVHTTVGTANTAASRPFYFINNSGMNLSGYRVMAFWTNSDDTTGFQTAQPISDGVRYRVNIPTTATAIAFGAAIGNKYSGTPSMSNDAFIFSTDFYEACTATVSIDATVNTLSASGYDSSSPPILTTSTGTFVPVS